MRGTVAKRLRRLPEAYGPKSEWTKDGYFPKHPHLRTYVIMTTYQTMVPRMILASTDKDKSKPIAVLSGAGGETFNYRYVPFLMNGRFEADTERRGYKAAKRRYKARG